MTSGSGEPAPGAGRLLCDEMLAGLARLLRSGGHDVGLAEPGTPDAAVAARAAAEGRTLITADRAFTAQTPGAVLLADGTPDAQARALFAATGLPPAPAPFTRCVMDNAGVRRASAEEARAAPDGAGAVWVCPACERTYWAGSHVRRMTERLEALGATAPSPAAP